MCFAYKSLTDARFISNPQPIVFSSIGLKPEHGVSKMCCICIRQRYAMWSMISSLRMSKAAATWLLVKWHPIKTGVGGWCTVEKGRERKNTEEDERNAEGGILEGFCTKTNVNSFPGGEKNTEGKGRKQKQRYQQKIKWKRGDGAWLVHTQCKGKPQWGGVWRTDQAAAEESVSPTNTV